MKKLTSLLLALLLLATALPALASPTGASPSDIALWQTQVPAPSGEFQKIQAVLGEGAAPVIQQRLDSSQRGAVIDNTPRAQLIAYFLTLGWRLTELDATRDLFSLILLTNLPAQDGVLMTGEVGLLGNGGTLHDLLGTHIPFAIAPGETLICAIQRENNLIASAKADTDITITLPDSTVYSFPKGTSFQKLN